jgi:hypothetical protein
LDKHVTPCSVGTILETPCSFNHLQDNIFGPRIEQVWHGTETLSEEVQLSTARHSLSGELAQEEKADDRIETKFHVFVEMGLD